MPMVLLGKDVRKKYFFMIDRNKFYKNINGKLNKMLVGWNLYNVKKMIIYEAASIKILFEYKRTSGIRTISYNVF